MEVSEYCYDLRMIILITTLVSIPLIIMGRYLEYKRDYVYKIKSECKLIFFFHLFINLYIVPFYKTNLIYLCIGEIFLIIPFQYPNLNSYYRNLELGSFICFPFSSMLSALTFIRFYFLLKLFKHSTKWTSIRAEYVW